MNKTLRRVLYGLLIWVIPFVIAFLIWDAATNTPAVSAKWFNAIMAVSFMISLGIAACKYFKDLEGDPVSEGWSTGITWFVVLVVMDLVVLVGLFNMVLTEFYPVGITYLGAPIIAITIGHVLKNNLSKRK